MNEVVYELDKECEFCSDSYKKKYHCPISDAKTNSLLAKIACQVEHQHQRNKYSNY